MNEQHLSGHHRTTLAQIFSHPLAHNLTWAEVTSLVAAMGTVVDRQNGDYAFDVGTERAFFRRPSGKDFDVEEVVRLRKLFTQAGISADGVPAAEAPVREATRTAFVVAADHHEARVFSLDEGSGKMAESKHIVPDDPHGFRRHLEHKKEADYAGERIPEDRAYYENIAQSLAGASTILLIGDATGKSSATSYLSAYLAETHNEIFRRIAGTVEADLSAKSPGELQTIGADFFAKAT